MMDQTQLSGIGNYLKAEILYDVGLSPLNIIENIPQQYIKKLYNSSIKLINKSYNLDYLNLKYMEINLIHFTIKYLELKLPMDVILCSQIQKLFDKQKII